MRRPFPAVVVSLLAVLLSVSCTTTAAGTGAAGDPSPTTVPATPTTAPRRATPTASPGCRPVTGPATVRSSHVDVPLRSSGSERTYKQYVPASYDGRPVPLIVDLHGYLSGAAGQVAMSNFAPLAEKAGFVVATPQGNGPLPYWNALPHDDLPNDVQFVSDVIDDVAGRLCIDPARVYVDGISNGAFMTSLVACRLADKVAAVGAVAGLLYPPDCAPSRPVPVLAIHGTADQFVSFEGGPNPALATLQWNDASTRAFSGLPFAPVTATAGTWAAAQGCTSPPKDEAVSPSVKLVRYEGCRDGSVVELYVVDGGGHTWPSSAFSKASVGVLGPTTDDIDASAVMWDFFQAHPMPG